MDSSTAERHQDARTVAKALPGTNRTAGHLKGSEVLPPIGPPSWNKLGGERCYWDAADSRLCGSDGGMMKIKKKKRLKNQHQMLLI